MITAESTIAVYIIASQRNGTLYTGVTSALADRIWQHKTKQFRGFSAKHGCTRLVWFQPYPSMLRAIEMEKWVKHKPRAEKLRLIERENPEWKDLSDGWYDETTWDFDGAYEASLNAR